ncbi:MAG: hypothetical protein ACUVS2_14150 [Candidatus Flexifilum sp.]|jgi:uncharacterized membrane protein YkvA (DUF1232 family)
MRRLIKEFFILGFTAIAVLYLINPTAGILEFVPDNLPVIGNLDEAAAVLIILATLRYYGLDLTRLYKREDPAQMGSASTWQPGADAARIPRDPYEAPTVMVEREEEYRRRTRS